MLHYYRVLYTTYNNGVKVGNTSGSVIADENEIKEKTIPITWENLKEVYYNFGLELPFNIWDFKRGRVISFFEGCLTDKNRRDIKEWKTPELNMKFVITYEVIPCSLNTILNYWDSEKAIQYLRERNLSCPIDVLKQS